MSNFIKNKIIKIIEIIKINKINKIRKGFGNLKKNIKTKEIKKATKEKDAKIKPAKEIKTDSTYFQTAKNWADDIYTSILVSRNRYKMAFYMMSGIVFLLALCILMLVPIQHTELVVVHEGAGGYTWLSTTKRHYHPPMNWVREQSEIAHYVVTRESYDPLLYRYQTDEVKLLSTPEVQAGYELAQSGDNKFAPINVLEAKGYRTVTIQSILPLDSEEKNRDNQSKKDRHSNLVQVNFVIVDHLFGQNKTIETPYTALVSWDYEGVPSDPNEMLKDWDGFKITKYVVQPKNLGNSDE